MRLELPLEVQHLADIFHGLGLVAVVREVVIHHAGPVYQERLLVGALAGLDPSEDL